MSSGGPAGSAHPDRAQKTNPEPDDQLAAELQNDASSPSAPADAVQQRLDKNFNELLQETRVTLTGIQILFAFLLTLPFSSRFQTLHTFQRGVYFVTLMSAGFAVVHLIAPVSYHRILFRHHSKDRIVAATNTMLMVGLGFTAGAVTGSLVLVTSVLYPWSIAALVGIVFAGLIVALWYVTPLLRRREATRSGLRD